jgi:hypothetical protein
MRLTLLTIARWYSPPCLSQNVDGLILAGNMKMALRDDSTGA